MKIDLIRFFIVPILVLLGILLYLVFNQPIFAYLSITLGSYKLIIEIVRSLKKGRFALDYIAFLAIAVSLFTQQYLVAAVVALMLSTGQTLEKYGVLQAKNNLSKLIDRIPDEVTVLESSNTSVKAKISDVSIGQKILIKKGEVIALDGTLISQTALIDESSLTGEPYTVEMVSGDPVRSGTINTGTPVIIQVTKAVKDSTYAKIINLVKNAQEEKSPLVRLADRYSTIFTFITLSIAGFAYFYSNGDFIRVLSVLVIATPCPLILATPVALMGGVNAASKRNIIIKKLASLEVLSKSNVLIFDKTGTITLGVPALVNLEILSKKYNHKKVYQIAEAIERNSLHPLAKAIVNHASGQNIDHLHASKVEEKAGYGIKGEVSGKKYRLSKIESSYGMEIGLFEGSILVAVFRFDDHIRPDSKRVVSELKKMGIQLFVFTGDKLEAAKRVVEKLGQNIVIKAGCLPEDKQKGVLDLKNKGFTVAMVGDGINDAPALALADVGLVFSNEEQTAASEASDIVILGNDFNSVYHSINIARNTVKIALQSIVAGIGLSIAGMVLASFGFIPPVLGAGLQEVIDVAVIINALRSSRSS